MSGCVLPPFAFQSTRAAEMNRLAVKEIFYHPCSCALHFFFVAEGKCAADVVGIVFYSYVSFPALL